MLVDRGQKVDMKMLEANIKLQDKVKDLEYDKVVLKNKLKNIKDICETVGKAYPECKPFASRIIFMVEKGSDEYDE